MDVETIRFALPHSVQRFIVREQKADQLAIHVVHHWFGEFRAPKQ